MIRTDLFSLSAAVAVATSAILATAQPADDVHVVGEAILASTAPIGPSVTGATACTDNAYALAQWHLTSTYKWNYNPAGAPASVASAAVATLQGASGTVASGQNRCRSTANLSTTQQYLGSTTKVAQISSTAQCTGNDGVSTTSWGSLPSGYLAYTCVYYRSSGAIVSSDMLIDNKAHQWFTTLPQGCANSYDLGSVATHERGHTAGLAHVDQAAHATETMSPNMMPCATEKRLLGLGDLLGLQKMYG